MRNFFISIGVCMCLVSGSQTRAQYERNYTARKTHSSSSKELIEAIKQQAQAELKRIEPKERNEVGPIYKARTDFLVDLVKQGAIIKDDSLQKWINRALDRLVKNNSLTKPPELTLVLKNPTVNAICFGEGTFAVTIGMLSRIRNEGELAFTLAHELAHYELDHVRNRILKQAQSDYYKKIRSGLSRLFTAEVTREDIENLRKLVYDGSRFSRANELEADQLGLVYLQKAGYYEMDALTLIDVLDSSTISKYPSGEQLFAPFHSGKYPFQQAWLNNRLSIYSKAPTSSLIFSIDSVESHPDMEIRKKELQAKISGNNTTRVHPDSSDELSQALITMAEFESVESAYFDKQADRCLSLALQEFNLYPKNAYLVSVISKVFIELIESRNSQVPTLFIPDYTFYYDDQLKLVNNFLHNLEIKEMGEVAFHFLNSQSNFNSEYEEHYYLLWKICDLTYREQVQRKVKEAYKNKFPEGEYYGWMKGGITLNSVMKSILAPPK